MIQTFEITVGGKTFDSYTQLCNYLNVCYSNECKAARRAGKGFEEHMQDKYGPFIADHLKFLETAGKFLYGHK